LRHKSGRGAIDVGKIAKPEAIDRLRKKLSHGDVTPASLQLLQDGGNRTEAARISLSTHNYTFYLVSIAAVLDWSRSVSYSTSR
jgi:hypothetical protein